MYEWVEFPSFQKSLNQVHVKNHISNLFTFTNLTYLSQLISQLKPLLILSQVSIQISSLSQMPYSHIRQLYNSSTINLESKLKLKQINLEEICNHFENSLLLKLTHQIHKNILSFQYLIIQLFPSVNCMSRSTSFSVSNDRKLLKQHPSRVLLVCVYQTIIFQLTNDQIFNKFSPFGAITKILIFQKGQVTKFFIQYTETQFAKQAKFQLDGTKFFENICKMNIYFSNFRNVDLRHQSSHGTDYQVIQQKRNHFIDSFDNLSRSSLEKNINYLDDDVLMKTFLPFGGADTFSRSKTDNPRNLQDEIMKMKKEQDFQMVEEQEVDRSIKHEIHSLLSQPPSVAVSKSVSPTIDSQPNATTRTTICYDLKQPVPLRNIYNLFSNFGNIECIITKKEKVFVKYRSGYFAAVGMNYLAGLNLCGNLLNLIYCDNQLQIQQKALEYSESIYFDESYDRFTSKRSITVNPPSDTLHVSSIKKEHCNEMALRKTFGQYGYIERVRILMQSNEKNMALVKFSTLKESFEAISDLHNKPVGGRRMQISFTKSKL